MLYKSNVGQLTVSDLRCECIMVITQEYAVSVYKLLKTGHTAIIWCDTIEVLHVQVFGDCLHFDM